MRVMKPVPYVVLETRPIGLLDVLDQIDDGVSRLVLSSLVEGGDRFKCIGLLIDEYSIALRQDHQTVR
jgi:hypothetical protein